MKYELTIKNNENPKAVMISKTFTSKKKAFEYAEKLFAIVGLPETRINIYQIDKNIEKLIYTNTK